MPSAHQIWSPGERGPLGQYLWDLRHAAGITLRQVEEEAGGRGSNAYVSQLETGKITRPSPAILHCLAEVYAAHLPDTNASSHSFEKMMELAGHVAPDAKRPRHPRGR